jgi:uncharacterized protein (TIGR00299 family) protein
VSELHLDCSSGISGDMLLGVLADLGVDFAPLVRDFAQAGVDVIITATREHDHGMAGMRVRVEAPGAQPLRHLPELESIVSRLPVSDEVRARSMRALGRLAEAEARVHGCSVEAVHFHEIGAVDTLVDVVGAFWGLERLGVSRVTCTELPWFSGTVSCAHGVMPLPAPATVELLRGKPVYPTDITGEIITPTGALLVDQMVSSFQSGPKGMLDQCGLGLGSMKLKIVNGLRAFLIRKLPPDREKITVLETNIDHLTGEELGHALAELSTAGALDVIFLPGVMKKNRPGGLLQVLCRVEDQNRLCDLIFAQTMTLGVRMTETVRTVLPRSTAVRPSPWGEMEAKRMELDGEEYSRPEFEALKALAAKTGKSVAQLRYLLGEK